MPTTPPAADGIRPLRPYEIRLHRLALRLPTGRRAWLPASLLYLVLLTPYLVTRFRAGSRSWFIDLIVYRDAGRQVLRGGHDLYRFVSTGVDLPFTYPPFAALLATWLAWFRPLADVLVWTAAEMATIGWLASVGFRPLLARTGPGRPYLLAALAAGATWLNPVRDVIKFGQVDLFLVALVVLDLTAKQPRWPRGLLVGLAAATKLTPALFIPYLWLSGRRKAAVVAAATFVLAELLAQAVIPFGSWDYWTRAATASSRLGSNSGASNQAIRGMVLRLHLNAHLSTALWLLLAVVVLVVAMRRAVTVHRRGDELAAVVLVGLLSVALSPVSWIHHLCWVMLAVALVADDLTDPLRVRWAAYLSVFFVLRMPWYGSTLSLHHGVLYPAQLLQSSFGLAVLGLLFWMPTRGSTGAGSLAGRGDDAALSGDRSASCTPRTRQEPPPHDSPQPDADPHPGRR